MKIYSGETLKGIITLKDENGELISDLSGYDITLMLRNKFDDYQVILDNSSLQKSQGTINFSFSAEQTKKLYSNAVFEMKVEKDGVVKIATQDMFNVIDNKIKDVE